MSAWKIPRLRWSDRSTRGRASQTNGAKSRFLPGFWACGHLEVVEKARGSDGAPPRLSAGSIGLVDLVRPAALAGARRLLAGVWAVPVAVAERDRRLDLELPLEAVAPLLPPLLVLELLFVQRRRLLDPVRVPELNGQLR